MATGLVERFEQLLADGQDNALLRFGLGAELLKRNQYDRAAEHLAKAVQHDPRYSAAWKLLGKALTAAGQRDAAIAAYRRGIEAAEGRGDQQAIREMRVFLRRLEKSAG